MREPGRAEAGATEAPAGKGRAGALTVSGALTSSGVGAPTFAKGEHVTVFTDAHVEAFKTTLATKGETVTFQPATAGGDKSVIVRIQRSDRQAPPGVAGVSRIPYCVMTAIDADTEVADDGFGGIKSTDLKNGATIAYKVDPLDADATVRPVVKVIEAKNGRVVFEVR